MASLDSADLNPIQFASDWHYFTIASQRSPGAIPVDGIKGFERETGWDEKKGKGVQGATLTLTTQPPAKGSIELQLWLPQHFTSWEAFLPLLKYDPAKKSCTDAASAFDIDHPALADLQIHSVVTHKVSPLRHKGRGLYIVTIDLIEWLRPPKVSIAQTTVKSKPDDPTKVPGNPPDPIIAADQADLAQAMRNLAAVQGGPFG